MWINVRFYDSLQTLLYESGAYNFDTGVLAHEANDKIYEIKPGLDSLTASLLGEMEGPSFHFVLNNKVYKDNRIPPRGFTNAAFADFGGAPADYFYADNQYWDDTLYAIPAGAVSAEITVYYQSTSKEFIDFLLEKNTTNSLGQEMYDLWNNNGKCPPEIMAQTELTLTSTIPCDLDGNYTVDIQDLGIFAYHWLETGCTGPETCGGADFDASGKVDYLDYAIFSQCWP